MTDKELKEFALIGLLVRIDAEKKKLEKTTDKDTYIFRKEKLDKMKNDYNNLLAELKLF
jgi:hypothetical protein